MSLFIASLFQGQCVGTLSGHDDEVLDVTFDYTGQYLLTASADSTARLYNVATQQMMAKLEGHEGEISKVSDLRIMLIRVTLCRCGIMMLD